MAEDWIYNNLNTVESALGGISIKWDNDTETPIETFIRFFEDVIEYAINNNKYVIKAIVGNDNGRGYDKLLLD